MITIEITHTIPPRSTSMTVAHRRNDGDVCELIKSAKLLYPDWRKIVVTLEKTID